MFIRFNVSRSIVNLLNETVELAKNIAQGDLKATNIKPRKDEVGALLNAIEEMRKNLSGLISSIQQSSASIENAAQKLDTPVQQVHAG
ncbi:MAG: HAMP domain-containing protein [Psychrobium sp.]|nr:HAMP domain-containing protein [Psychrobium sp.]